MKFIINKNFFILLLKIFYFFESSAVLESFSSLNLSGVVNINNQKYFDVKVNGMSSFDNIQVLNNTKINGAFDSKNFDLNNLDVNGSCNLNKGKVNGIFKLKGSLSSDYVNFCDDVFIFGTGSFYKSTFNKNLNLNDFNVKFRDCKIEGKIFIKKRSFFGKIFSFFSAQKVILYDTDVFGGIEFEEAGKVYLYGSSKVDGKVENCEIIMKS